jgi:hypothetical protein
MLFTDLIWGPLLISPQALPLTLDAQLCDLRPRFLPKGMVGNGHRAIARNGRVLLATDRPLAELVDQPAHTRLQVWHRAILPGDAPEPYGLLVCVRGKLLSATPPYVTQLVAAPDAAFALAVDVGGGRVLEFRTNPSRSGGLDGGSANRR